MLLGSLLAPTALLFYAELGQRGLFPLLAAILVYLLMMFGCSGVVRVLFNFHFGLRREVHRAADGATPPAI